MKSPVIEVRDLGRRFELPREGLFRKRRVIYALNGINFTVRQRQNFGIVGESGCGKSTLARLIMALDRPSTGSIKILGKDLGKLSPKELRAMRSHCQMVFQDPFGSLNPRHKVGRIVAEPLFAVGKDLSKQDRKSKVTNVLRAVGLREADMEKYPHEFSGGQRQRVAIARALITRPSLIVADEPTSALDVSVQAQVLNLLRDIQDQFTMTYLFISHNLAVVAYMCQEAAVIYQGHVMEQGPTPALFSKPLHPYTQSLVEAVPQFGAKRASIADRAAPALDDNTLVQNGCVFVGRCPFAKQLCFDERPALLPCGDDQLVACHFAGEIAANRSQK